MRIQKSFSLVLCLVLLLSSGCTAGKEQPGLSSFQEQPSHPTVSGITDIINNDVSNIDSKVETSSILIRDRPQDMSDILKRATTTKNYNSVIKQSYPQKDLIGSINFWRTPNTSTMLDWLDERFPVECIRAPKKGLTYNIYKLKEGGLLYIFFHGDSLKFADYIFVVKKPLVKSDFNVLKKGDSLKEVEQVDPGVKVINSASSGYLRYRASCHMVKEGFIRIEYESKPKEYVYGDAYDLNTFQISKIEFIPNGGNILSYGGVFGGEPPVERTYQLLDGDYPQ